MREPDQTNITVSADVWNLISRVPAKELESALRKAFPEHFKVSQQETKLTEDLQFVRELSSMAMPKPTTDIDEDLAQRRSERHRI